MKVLAASDIHGNHDTYRWLAHMVDQWRPEAMVLAGDLLGVPDGFERVEDAQRHDAARVSSILSGLRIPVLFIMGNDDWVELEPESESLQSLHARCVVQGQHSFVGYQFTLPFMGGIHEKPEESIRADLEVLEPLLSERTVLVTHSPAYGSLDVGVLGQSVGSLSLRDLIDRRGVRVHIHGHIHECFGREGSHFNVAAGRHQRAMLIDLRTLEHEILQAN